MSARLMVDGVENPANIARIEDAARLLGASCSNSAHGRLIAVENARGAGSIYARKALRDDVTIAVGNERRGLSKRILSQAQEIVAIPTQSRTITTLNVAAAAAVGGWYVLRGSGPQPQAPRPEVRRPAVLIIGDDHVEVGSTLRSAAAFGFRDVLLEDRGAGWFDGPPEIRREAFAAARRHKNALRVHRGEVSFAERFEEVVVVLPSGIGVPVHRQRLTHGRRQVVIIGAPPEVVADADLRRATVVTLGLEPVECPPLRLVGSILLAEIARQVGARRPMPGRPAARPPAYDAAISLVSEEEVLVIEAPRLLEY